VPKSRGFQNLLTAAPTPLPDDEELQAAAESSGDSGRPDPAAAPAARRRGRTASQSEQASAPEAPASPSTGEQAGEWRAARTIRLHEPAAAALNSAWLHERMTVNPKLSYPEFASEIVRLGLAARRQAKAEAEARPVGGE
jgi:hypothetical protein